MKRLMTGILLAALALSAQATLVFNGGGTLTGDQEVPPNNSPGTGTALVTVDDDNDLDPNTNLLAWDVTFSNLEAPFLAAHFHGPAFPGQVAPVIVPITDSLIGAPDTSGELIGSANITSEQFADLAAGKWYVNVHSTLFPAGEIRAQVLPAAVPEPSGMALLGLALASLVGGRRRQRVE